MKILHVGYSDILGGAAIAMNRLHKAMLSCGLNSEVLVLKKINNDLKVIGADNKSEVFLNEIKIKLARQKKYFYRSDSKNSHSLNIFNSNIVKKIEKINPDIVNLHWINNELISIKQISKIKLPIVWTFLDMWPMCGGEHYVSDERYIKGYDELEKRKDERGIDLNKFLWKQKKKYLVKKINHIVCISEWLKKKAEISYLFKNKKIFNIPCTINNDEWRPIDKQQARKELGLPEKKKIYLFISTNGEKDKRKGYQFINNYFKNKKENNNLLIKIGDHKEKNFDFEINLNTFFHGDHKKLKIYYSACDILLSPSTLEAFGQVAIEAASCGVPTIGFKNTGLEESVSHLKTGYLANYLDQNDFNIGLDFLSKKIDENQKYFYNNCIKFVNDKFKNSLVVNQYKDIYESILYQ